ncbi:YigZ family protein [Propioniciclava coleopterorum]|uniref:YigZ family protein n=1 Tax=Propioniciclava coleopterorum TaxID=2714937 RepID=A0A6G7Y6Q6_9ACTN|nr:YigZ family protein [Propioniciclava coleopterorum]QIK72495.1 YigZ family protein [Propioniciclava coleopterorum]
MRTWLPRGFEARTETEVKRSRFLATVARVDDEAQARDVIALVRAEFPDARHHCQAFVVDVPDAQPIERSSDDGEPAGTAGMPMLEVLRGAALGNVVAVVTRYFGGTLLGTGGLVRAYSDAVSSALAGAPRVRPERRLLWGVDVPAAEAGRVQGALLNRGIDVLDAAWAESVRLTLAVADPDAVLPILR